MASPAPPSMRIRFDAFELDATSGELRKNGILLRLQPQPFRVLLLLIERAGQVVTREEIQRCLWTDSTFVDFEHGINFSINQIRGALVDSAENPRYVETIPRRGYRFIGTVEQPPSANITVLRSAPEALPEKAAPRRWFAIVSLTAMVIAISAAAAYVRFHRAPVLTDKDTIVLADFTNTTGDAVFDGTLRQGLSVQLEQSPFLSLISDKRIEQTLRMMGQPVGTKLTPEIARELCQRTASAAVLDGSIAQIGAQYVLILKAVDCAKGEAIASTGIQASDKSHVLEALGKASSEIRNKLGESLSTVKKFDTPLEQATTSSLEALQAYSLGWKTMVEDNEIDNLVPLFQRATRLDPNFAMAYAALGVAFSGSSRELAEQNTRKAYELRERVSERERFYIESHYHVFVTGDIEKAIQVYEIWGLIYPRDWVPPNNLGNLYYVLGQYEKGLEQTRRAVRVDPASAMSYGNVVSFLLALGRLEEARVMVQEAQTKKVDKTLLYRLDFLQNDRVGMERQVAWAAGRAGVEDALLNMEAHTQAYCGKMGKARELFRRAANSAQRNEQKETAAEYESAVARIEADYGNSERSRQYVVAALASVQARDVPEAAVALARAGDSVQADTMANEWVQQFPGNTILNRIEVPTIRSAIEINRNNPSKAIELLETGSPYELGAIDALYSVYLRGLAYVLLRQGNEAATEFQKIFDHRGVVGNEHIGALARLGLARAYVLQGDTAKAKAAYQDFLTLWKDADPDIPILKEAKSGVCEAAVAEWLSPANELPVC